eukprot:6469396-Ditylum_brightwellii.AAC.1
MEEVYNAIMCMCSTNVPGPSDITSDTLCAMVFQQPDPDYTGCTNSKCCADALFLIKSALQI